MSAKPQKQLLKFFSIGSSALGISGFRRVSWMLEAAGKVWWGFLDHSLKCRNFGIGTVTFGIAFFKNRTPGQTAKKLRTGTVSSFLLQILKGSDHGKCCRNYYTPI